MTSSQYVRCKDATMVRDILTEGEVYELQGIDRYGMYLVKGLWLTGERFEPASREEWLMGLRK